MLSIEETLVIILSILVLLLVFLLVIRIRAEKKRLGMLGQMTLVEFSDFLRSNSLEGNIQAVAGKVSHLLTNSFGCERIIFLRKKRGALELNYYHGISNFSRRDFQVPFRNDLAEQLSADFLPMRIDKIKASLSADLYQNLAKHKVDTYFPIYWRHNLYGVYFVSSSKEIRSPAFTLLVASLAQSLSAAYHIKWHETRLHELEQKLGSTPHSAPKDSHSAKKTARGEADLLPLIKIRDTDKLLPRIIDSLSDNLDFGKFAFTYRGASDRNELQHFNKGTGDKIDSPDTKAFRNLFEKIRGKGPQLIQRLDSTDPNLGKWFNQLRQSGLEYIVDFPISSEREGVLVWAAANPNPNLHSQLETYKKSAFDLIENAEAYKQAEVMSYTDALTGLANQRYMYMRLEEEINRARRYSRPLTFIIFDIDELKNINDSYGHQAGDALLKQVGVTLKKSIRAIDIVARYGGDEFCVVMPEADEETCVKFMQRMLDTVNKTEINLEGSKEPAYCSISMGGALFPQHAQDPQKLVYVADMALLQAKESGRNRFLIYAAKGADS